MSKCLWYITAMDDEPRGPFESAAAAMAEYPEVAFRSASERRYEGYQSLGDYRRRIVYILDYIELLHSGALGDINYVAGTSVGVEKNTGPSPVQCDPIDILRGLRYRVYKQSPHYRDHGLRGANAKWDRAYDMLDNAIRHLSGKKRKRRVA